MSFSSATRDRFDKLLRLATKSTFAGERNNALAAARRIAAKHGMSLGEASRRAPEPKAQPESEIKGETSGPRRHYGPYRRTHNDSSMSDKAEALRVYARMRAADRKEEATEEWRANAIFAGVLLLLAASGATPILYLYLQETLDADPDATLIDLLLQWFGQFF